MSLFPLESDIISGYRLSKTVFDDGEIQSLAVNEVQKHRLISLNSVGSEGFILEFVGPSICGRRRETHRQIQQSVVSVSLPVMACLRALLASRLEGFGSLSCGARARVINKIRRSDERNLFSPLAGRHFGSFSRPAFLAARVCPKVGPAQFGQVVPSWQFLVVQRFCQVADGNLETLSRSHLEAEDLTSRPCKSRKSTTRLTASLASVAIANVDEHKAKRIQKKSVVEFSKIDVDLLPTVILVGRPNVGKSALFNRLIRRREALVYNTPDDHVTRDIREGIAKLGDLRFKVLDSAGLETAATSGSILNRTAEMTGNVLARSQFAIFLIDVRDGLQPLDMEVGKWLRKHAPTIRTVLALNKSESLDERFGFLTAAAAEAHALGFGDPVAISAETGLGMVDLYEALQPLLEDYILQTLNDNSTEDNVSLEADSTYEEAKLPLQLAIVGRPNVGKSTLLNALLQQDRVLVGPEAGLTRDSVRAQFEFEGRTVYLVDTAGWLQRTGKEKGPASLSVMQSRKNLMRAHIIALVLDAEEV
ncbi:hypothetical protein ACLOJK_015376 [Asimina triloba]